MAAASVLKYGKEFLKNSPGVTSASVLMLTFEAMYTSSFEFSRTGFYGLFGVLLFFGALADLLKDVRHLFGMEDSKKMKYRNGLGIPFLKFKMENGESSPYIFFYMVYRLISNVIFLLAMTVVIEAHGKYFATCGNGTADNPERALCGSENGIIISAIILVMVRAVFKYPWKEVEEKKSDD